MTDSGLRSRADEVKLVLAALSEQGFDDVEPKDAEAILRAAVQVVMARDWYIVVKRTEEGRELVDGLFATEGAALRAVKANGLGILGGWQVGIVHINNAEKQLERVRIL